MEQSSPFAQRLKSISARRKLHELILSTRLDLEQEKLRAQRLKRKSLREQWLMEGTLASPEDRDPLSPLREAETRIEELQQTLTSLQVQMQQLDSLETWKVPRQPPSKEPIRDMDKVDQSADDREKVDATALSSSEGRSGAESALESAPGSSPRLRSAEAKENLQNGEMQDGDLSGHECGPEEAKVKAVPMAMQKGEHRLSQGDYEAASPVNPAGQSLDPGKAPASHQRKLAMEEIVIRDHLGQEVGCMDAVRQNQDSLEKEEESEDHMNLEDRSDSGNQPGPVDGFLDHEEALEEGSLDSELGHCDGPEGELSTSQFPLRSSSLLQNENGCANGQEDRLLEVGSLAKEASGKEGGQKEGTEQGAQEMPALAPTTGDVPTTESVEQSQTEMPEQQESGAMQEEQGRAEFPQQSQAHTPTLVDQVISPPLEVESLALEHISSSQHERKKTVTQQGELVRQEGEGSLPNTVHSFTNQLPLPDPMVSLQDTTRSALEESPVALEDQTATPPEAQVPPWPDSDVFLPDQIPPSVDDPCENPKTLQDQIPPVLLDPEPSSPVGEIPAPSLQEADGTLPEEIQRPPPSHTSPDLPEEEGSSPDEGLPTSEEQSTASLLGQTPSFQEAAKSLPEGWNVSEPPEERSPLVEQTPSSDTAQSPLLLDASLCPHALLLSSQETPQAMPDKMEPVENQDAKESGGAASVGSVGAEETPEVLEGLCSEQQPLLKEAIALGTPLDISVGDPQSMSGLLKSQVATNQRVPNNGTRTSANAASSHPPQADLPRQGEDEDPERNKQKPKSCQCCLLM